MTGQIDGQKFLVRRDRQIIDACRALAREITLLFQAGASLLTIVAMRRRVRDG